MEIFEKKIENKSFRFNRVFYGNDLWYHITFKDENGHHITFRVHRDEQNIWKIAAQTLPIEIFDLELKFGDAIEKNEIKC